MGTKGRKFEYQEERDRDLLSAFHRQLDRADHPLVMSDILSRTVNSPARRFWVSEDRAFRIISKMTEGIELEGMSINKRKMFYEIYQRVAELRKDPKNAEEKLTKLICIVLEQKAPCFYLTPESAAVLLCHIKKRRCRTRNTES